MKFIKGYYKKKDLIFIVIRIKFECLLVFFSNKFLFLMSSLRIFK